MTFACASKMPLNETEFRQWLNPDMPHEQKYDRARLLSQYVQVDEATYWYFLEMMPPHHFSSWGFSMCELTTCELRLAFFRIAGRFFAAHVSDHANDRCMAATRALIAHDALRTGIIKTGEAAQ